ncbi:hypothetical protein, partial [Embleya sp. NPDC005971]|uniref:hypothetical protein n=1 Tax=Embleya sp. NPDC005971 TaxID=3156724 RepID=UPI00340422EC
LGGGSTGLQWIAAAYTLTFAVGLRRTHPAAGSHPCEGRRSTMCGEPHPRRDRPDGRGRTT